MNRTAAVAAALLAAWLFPAIPAAAEPPPAIADVNGDGKITIDDALIIAGQMSAADPTAQSGTAALPGTVLIPDGSGYQSAYVYTGFDSFDRNTLTVQAGESFTLLLRHTEFDSAQQPVVTPVSGAVITFNGHESDYVTDSLGQAVMTLTVPGVVTVSAKTESVQTVPPLAQVLVIEENAAAPASPVTTGNIPSYTAPSAETVTAAYSTAAAGSAGSSYAPEAALSMGDAETRKPPRALPLLLGGAALFAVGTACRYRRQRKRRE